MPWFVSNIAELRYILTSWNVSTLPTVKLVVFSFLICILPQLFYYNFCTILTRPNRSKPVDGWKLKCVDIIISFPIYLETFLLAVFNIFLQENISPRIPIFLFWILKNGLTRTHTIIRRVNWDKVRQYMLSLVALKQTCFY